MMAGEGRREFCEPEVVQGTRQLAVNLLALGAVDQGALVLDIPGDLADVFCAVRAPDTQTRSLGRSLSRLQLLEEPVVGGTSS